MQNERKTDSGINSIIEISSAINSAISRINCALPQLRTPSTAHSNSFHKLLMSVPREWFREEVCNIVLARYVLQDELVGLDNIADEVMSLISVCRPLSQVASEAVSASAMYSASSEAVAVVVWRRDFHDIAVPFRVNTYPVVEHAN